MSDRPLTLSEHSELDIAARVAAVLRKGKIVALPAEGIYGLHALASSPEAVDRIRSLKGAPSRRGFIGLLATPEDLSRWTVPDKAALDLANRYWPGPLTLVLTPRTSAPAALRAEDGTIALRCPGNEFLRSVVAGAGGIVISSSANRPGDKPAIQVEEIPSGWADLTVDGGPLSGVASTLVRVVSGRIEMLREGAVRLGDAALDDAPEAT